MKFAITSLLAVLLAIGSAFAAPLQYTRDNDAQISVAKMSPIPFVTGDPASDWASIPSNLAGATIYMPTDGISDSSATVDIRVTGQGVLLLACKFSSPEKGIWSKEDFLSHGWHLMTDAELGTGKLARGSGGEYFVFAKYVHAGDRLRIRCNKNVPPFPILF